MHNLRNKFDKISAIVKQFLKNLLDPDGNLPRRSKKPKFSDVEVIALSLLSESLMIDSENCLFKLLHNNYKEQFPNLIERSRFNRRRKQLHHLIEKFRIHIVEQLVKHKNSFLIDSMPLPIVRFSRAKRARICREDYQSAPSFGYCAAHNQPYFGYKLHGVATVNGVMTHFDLSKAHVHDIEYFKDIRHYYPNCTLLGDRAYLSNPLQLELFEENRLFLITPMRRNQKNYQKQPA
ncbi:MAG: IS982 family transposase, partial [Calditrichaeota bacterium]|nr:IS982 family transposase [Calditrichota bacterium]